MKDDTIIKTVIILIILNLMLLLLLCCGCTAPREIYTREFQLYTHTGDTTAVLYKGNRFLIYRDTVTRVNEYGDTYTYPKNRVRIQDGEIQITDNVGTIHYRP